jgi:hypothetical protein
VRRNPSVPVTRPMPAMDRHRRLTRHAALAAALSLLVMVALAGTAAAAVPVFRSSFTCSVATPCGSVTSMDAGRLAVNEATGDVYVLDATADAILVFDSDGTYLSQISPSATTSGTFELGEEADIAVDNSIGSNAGNIYVNSENASINGNPSTFAFDPTGTFLWEAGGFTDECGIGVDPANGNLYAMDLNSGFQQLDPADGSAIGSAVVLTGLPACHFEFDSTGALIAAQFNGRIDKFNAADGSRILRFPSSDTHVDAAVDRSNDDVYGQTAGHGTEKWVTTGGAADPASPFGPVGVGAAINSTNSTVYISAGTEVQIFEPARTFTLTAATDGTGSGSVTADHGAVSDCGHVGGTCSDSYPDGDDVTLSPTADAGSAFAGWVGCDNVAGDLCTVDMNADKNVTATFNAVPQRRLTVSKAGIGSGSVSSSPAGITCGATCDALFDEGTQVTLTATPAANSTFTGWSGGGCTGTGTCRVTLNADTTVTATFAPTDTDGDGVPDNSDSCPNEAAATANGCPAPVTPPTPPPPPTPDTDGDGVLDSADACPTVAASTSNGCPPNNDAALGQCVATANKAYNKARKAAKKKHGKARARAMKAANKRKAKAVKQCRELLA